MDTSARLEYLAGLLRGLSAFSDSLAQEDSKGFGERFAAFKPVGTDGSTKAAKDPENMPKNRYRNVLTYDHSRVHLDTSMLGGTDYINASWIHGFQQEKKYIATQGAVPATIPDFWMMIWQYKVSIIVKVTREVENQTLKCHRYWPDPESEPPQKKVTIGKIEIEHLSSKSQEQFIVRKFKLRHGQSERDITQFSYEAWPDHGVPLTAREFLDFRACIKAEEAKTPQAPIVVHCSAGVGRTGTYIVVDRVLECVENGVKSSDLDLDKAIRNLRERRPLMVQTVAQYKFCYDSVLSGIRRELEKFKDAQATPETKEFIATDKKTSQEADRKEDDDIREIVRKRAARIQATSFDEVEQMEKAWTRDESYDVDYQMSDLESRFVSLAMTGCELDLTPALPEQIRALILKAKALDQRKQQEKEEQEALESARRRERVAAEMEAAKSAAQKSSKSAAERKAEKFMRKKSNGP
eukprot:m.182615 g.182615  ORF g.182615 m.182615 type:complete len:467 (+) comp14979_c0_seq1:86-1486(+)